MAKVKVGVIGCGKMGSFHSKILKGLNEAKLVGVFDQDPERSKAAADQLGVRPYDTYELLFGDCDAVVIATPTPTHFEIAKDAILCHKHILVEKPLADSSALAKDLVSLCKNKNLKCSVGMIERFNPAFQKLLRLIKGQKIIGVDIKRLSPYPERIKESVIFDMMIHDIDLALTLNRTKVEDLRAYGKKKRSETIDESYVTLYFKDGMICKLDASRLKEHKERKITVTTEKGIYEADLLNKKLSVRSFDNLIEKSAEEVKNEDQLSLELRSFLLSIQKDRSPEVTLEDGLNSLKIAEEVEKTACS